MIGVLCAAEARAFDAYASERAGVPSLVLMENAGRGAADRLQRRLSAGARVLVLAGPGNNGGDGFVLARHLLARGVEVEVALLFDPAQARGDAGVNLKALGGVGGRVFELQQAGGDALLDGVLEEALGRADACVDALFGTGLGRPLSGRHARVVQRLNESAVPTHSLDVPSGLSADTGQTLGAAVAACRTYAFGHAKRGLLTTRGAELSGPVEVVDLGVSPTLGPGADPGAWWLEAGDVGALARPRALSAHKGQSGRVAVVAGSPGKTGAALLTATAALRAGAGLVTVCNLEAVTASLDQRVLEVMTCGFDPDRLEAGLDEALAGAHAVVIGPGLGLDERARRIVDHVVLGFAGPAVVDADAITHFTGRAEALREARGPRLLTPHSAELGRLIDASAGDVESDRFGALSQALERSGQHVLLKGPHTLIGSPGAPIWVSSFGSAVLATGGSGDVLSGVCGALAVGSGLREAAALGSALHGVAARLWVDAHRGADRGLLAGELAELLPAARVELSDARGPLTN